MQSFQDKFSFVGFEVLTAVVMRSTIFWDMTSVDFQRTRTDRRRKTQEESDISENLSNVGDGEFSCLVYAKQYKSDEGWVRNMKCGHILLSQDTTHDCSNASGYLSRWGNVRQLRCLYCNVTAICHP
jgi:hypothetical protein